MYIFIIKVVVGVIILLVFLALLFNYCDWKINVAKTAPRISFKTFKTMYELNPNSFLLSSTYFKHNYKLAEFNSYISLLRYYLFKHNLDKEYSKERRRERTEDLIESFQKDIDDYKEQQESELKKYSYLIIKQVKESTERYEKMKGDIYDNSQRSKDQNRTGEIKLG